MQVKIIQPHSFQAVGPLGPTETKLAVGDLVDLPEMHATTLLIQGKAVRVAEKPAKAAKADAPAEVDAEAEAPAEKPAPARKK